MAGDHVMQLDAFDLRIMRSNGPILRICPSHRRREGKTDAKRCQTGKPVQIVFHERTPGKTWIGATLRVHVQVPPRGGTSLSRK
jgi:hypothetical protein